MLIIIIITMIIIIIMILLIMIMIPLFIVLHKWASPQSNYLLMFLSVIIDVITDCACYVTTLVSDQTRSVIKLLT